MWSRVVHTQGSGVDLHQFAGGQVKCEFFVAFGVGDEVCKLGTGYPDNPPGVLLGTGVQKDCACAAGDVDCREFFGKLTEKGLKGFGSSIFSMNWTASNISLCLLNRILQGHAPKSGCRHLCSFL